MRQCDSNSHDISVKNNCRPYIQHDLCKDLTKIHSWGNMTKLIKSFGDCLLEVFGWLASRPK